MDPAEPLDALIIGAGPAGLSAALTLARQLHTVVVFDSTSYRNATSSHMHTVLTWDHKDPNDFRGAAHQNILDGYETVEFVNVELKSIRKTDKELFEVIGEGEGKRWIGRKVVLATGSTDIFPEIEGYGECWSKGIFHCLFCHGYEERNAPSSGVLAIGDVANVDHAMHFARNAAQLTPKKATIYTNGDEKLAATIAERIKSSSTFHVDSREIVRLEKGLHRAEVIIHFRHCTTANEGFLGHKPKNGLKTDFAEQLGLEITPQGDVKTTPPFNQTTLGGVFAAGDISSPMKVVNNGLFTGSLAGVGVSAQLQAEKHGQPSLV